MTLLPKPSERTRPFWEAGRAGKLRIQRCSACGTRMHPPDLLCSSCGSEDLGWEEVAGDGTLYSFTVYHNVAEGEAKPVIGVVELAEQEGLYLPCDLTHAGVEDGWKLGMEMRVTFEERTPGLFLPQFVPAGEETATV